MNRRACFNILQENFKEWFLSPCALGKKETARSNCEPEHGLVFVPDHRPRLLLRDGHLLSGAPGADSFVNQLRGGRRLAGLRYFLLASGRSISGRFTRGYFRFSLGRVRQRSERRAKVAFPFSDLYLDTTTSQPKAFWLINFHRWINFAACSRFPTLKYDGLAPKHKQKRF